MLATVLSTDLVDSTQRAAQAGDRARADMLERHLADTRTAIAVQRIISDAGDSA